MICGSIEMNLELKEYLEGLGFTEGNNREPGEYVLEKSFVEKMRYHIGYYSGDPWRLSKRSNCIWTKRPKSKFQDNKLLCKVL